uniref:Uncharacterized protein n=1 Tax=Candidatus Kentrum sp. LFY TaxID=2126342 RepID=A0A450WK37_9GAMM|nr:MAG: hypothetical protein BECKLFY1418C_GA0070996_103112 [Candidatus Kentron sp. LFY]
MRESRPSWYKQERAFCRQEKSHQWYREFLEPSQAPLTEIQWHSKGTFIYLFLKECEWRFNHSDQKFQLNFIKQLVRNEMF